MFSFFKKRPNPAIAHVVDTTQFLMMTAIDEDQVSAYQSDNQKRNVIFAFAYGAIDALSQQCNLNQEETLNALKQFFENFCIKSPTGNTDSLINVLCATIHHPDTLPIVTAGGRAMIDFTSTNPLAGKALAEYL